MKVKHILEDDREPGQPYWERDTDRKVYTVYDKDGNVYSEHKYDQVWNSSPAYKAAANDVQELKVRERNKEKQYREFEAPLTELEKRYAAGRDRMTEIMRLIKQYEEGSPANQALHDEYMKIAEKLKSINDYVRGSVIRGDHKDMKK